MKTLPLTTPEVRSILAGRKTRITLPVEPQPEKGDIITEMDKFRCCMDSPFRVGDVVGVKEEFNVHDLFYDDYAGGWEAGYPLKDIPAEKHRNCCVSYRADDDMGEWRAAADMPTWAIRLHLRVTSVSVYRVCRISHEEAIAEGCEGFNWVASSPYIIGPHTDDGELPVEEFRREWQSKHPAHPFDSAWGFGYGVEVQGE